MAKKIDSDFSELDKIQCELEKFGLKLDDDFKIEIHEPLKLQNALKDKFQDPAQIWVEQLRIEITKLGLKIIDDINDRRVAKPEETYNSLVALYNAVKL